VLTRQSLLDSAASEAARHAAVEEHQSILEALRRHDGPAAALAMRRHVENARQRAESADRLRQR
jgi:DNA-binding GntR family transcriptional regulator